MAWPETSRIGAAFVRTVSDGLNKVGFGTAIPENVPVDISTYDLEDDGRDTTVAAEERADWDDWVQTIQDDDGTTVHGEPPNDVGNAVGIVPRFAYQPGPASEALGTMGSSYSGSNFPVAGGSSTHERAYVAEDERHTTFGLATQARPEDLISVVAESLTSSDMIERYTERYAPDPYQFTIFLEDDHRVVPAHAYAAEIADSIEFRAEQDVVVGESFLTGRGVVLKGLSTNPIPGVDTDGGSVLKFYGAVFSATTWMLDGFVMATEAALDG
ncbi:hypothetical protein FZEAL_1372 [Fusarium zealandicum]|uniref:Uncharacterized protein n=1 Tax=Fusarium zealandicum TaxID=1053134 RepID=A0A8H4UTI0_9HYPO|nr:hypothetical protein FZEAL_1372 [Fusarium zealandicum]